MPGLHITLETNSDTLSNNTQQAVKQQITISPLKLVNTKLKSFNSSIRVYATSVR